MSPPPGIAFWKVSEHHLLSVKKVCKIINPSQHESHIHEVNKKCAKNHCLSANTNHAIRFGKIRSTRFFSVKSDKIYHHKFGFFGDSPSTNCNCCCCLLLLLLLLGPSIAVGLLPIAPASPSQRNGTPIAPETIGG